LIENIFSSYPSHWELTTLGEVALRGGGDIQTGPFGSQLHAADYVNDGIPSVMPKNIGDNEISEESIARIKEADAVRLARYRLKAGDIVYSRRGDVERHALVRKHQDGWLCGTGCLRIRLGNGPAIPEFVAHYLAHPNVRSYIVQHAIGATMANLNTSILSRVPFLLPPKNEQLSINSILSTLDTKIELNRRMNETLEEMARAIFKDWFVDFGPTRAKMEGRAAYLTSDIWDLFPDKLDDDEIPSGWKLKPFTELIDIIGGGTPKTSEPDYWDGDIPWFSVVDTPASGSVYVSRTAKSITKKGLSESSARLVPKHATIISARGTVGNLAMAAQEMTFNQSCYALQSKTGVGAFFTYLMAQQMVSKLQFMAHGSVFSTITRDTFASVLAASPSTSVFEEFNRIQEPLFARINANVLENQTLVEIRDLLLPRLMSGEITVSRIAKEFDG